LRTQYWCAIADVLHMSLQQIDELTVDDFDTAVEYVKKKAEGGR